jgi:hypothetical protein
LRPEAKFRNRTVIITGMMYSIIFIWGFGSMPSCPTLLRPYIDKPIISGMM